ncbi:mycolate reductase [Pseudonocardia yuanmonensis]|uniref:Mycolate reductase n=1 Tax=Pseudonocardia yuanmonensis TaxID=1095914 RepID=A0ABP8VW83_9PSEU
MADGGLRPLALVTGASAGIGEAFARELAARGHDLIVVARRRERLEALAADLPTAVRVVPADLSTEEGLADVERVIEESPVGLLVNNAGLGVYGPVSGQDLGALAATVAVNVEAPVRLTRAALPRMVDAGAGGVIAVSSPAGQRPKPRLAAYAASKAFIDLFFEALRQEVAARGVGVTIVSPGYTRTEWHCRAGQDVSAVRPEEWLQPAAVARAALDAWAEGRPRVDLGTHAPRALPMRVARSAYLRLPPRVRDTAGVQHLRELVNRPERRGEPVGPRGLDVR